MNYRVLLFLFRIFLVVIIMMNVELRLFKFEYFFFKLHIITVHLCWFEYNFLHVRLKSLQWGHYRNLVYLKYNITFAFDRYDTIRYVYFIVQGRRPKIHTFWLLQSSCTCSTYMFIVDIKSCLTLVLILEFARNHDCTWNLDANMYTFGFIRDKMSC